ncbi:MAG: hypothetical protein HQ580_15685 [Planctomycetes bacterium]|nr:hypothetical protein [Planctomycetota bacterium]
MSVNEKQIVIDKDAFQGIGFNDLRKFARNHQLLVCDTLLYECLTDTGNRRLLDRCRKLIESGAYYCSCSAEFLQWEGRNLTPYPRFLPDLQKTERIRKGSVRPEGSFTPQELEKILGLRTRIAKDILIRTVERVGPRISSERPDIATNVKTLTRDTCDRMAQWLEGLDVVGMHDLAVRSMPDGWAYDDASFCRSREWISWQYFRLASVLANEYYYLAQTGGIPGGRRAEHDHQDMEYVLLLSRADALITRDKKLSEPLAIAAFPNKDVFSNLDEVPEEYVCNWS